MKNVFGPKFTLAMQSAFDTHVRFAGSHRSSVISVVLARFISGCLLTGALLISPSPFVTPGTAFIAQPGGDDGAPDLLHQRALQERAMPPDRSVLVPPSLIHAQLNPIELRDHPETGLSLNEAVDRITAEFESLNSNAADQVDAPEPDEEAFRQCELLFIKAREEYLRNDYFSSIQTAEQALRYDRHAVPVLRLLAHNYLETTGKAQALLYFRRILQNQAYDEESLMRVANAWLEQGRDIEAAEYYARLLLAPEKSDVDRPDLELRELDDAGLRYVAAATLGDLLSSLGYARAAIQSWEIVANAPSELPPSHHFQREISTALLRRGTILLQQGDAYMRLNEPQAALKSYQRATAFPLTNPESVLPRMVFAYLVIGQPYTAMESVLRHLLDESRETPPLDDLLVYLRPYPESELLASAIAEAAGRRPDSLSMVLAGATLLPDEKSVRLVEDFLAAHPERANDRLKLLQWAKKTGGNERAARLLLSQGAFLSSQPEVAASEFLEIVGRDPAIIEAWNAMPPDIRDREPTQLVFSQILSNLGRYEEAEQLLRTVQVQQADDVDLRLTLASTLIDGGQLTDARRVLFDLRNSEGVMPNLALHPGRSYRAAELFARVGDTESAEKIYEQLQQRWKSGNEAPSMGGDLTFDPDEFAVRHARFLQQIGETGRAIATLRSAVDANPDATKPMEELLDIYGTEGEDFDARRYRETIQVLLRRDPDARSIRMLQARQEAAAGRHDGAISTLKSLLQEDWSDEQALALLVREWIDSEQLADGIRWIEGAREDRPGHVELLEAYVDLLVASGQPGRAINELRSLLERNPYDDVVSSKLISVLRRAGRLDESYRARSDRLAHRPKSVERLILQANLAIDEEQYVEALNRLKTAAEHARGDLPFHVDRIVALADKLRTSADDSVKNLGEQVDSLVLGAIRGAWDERGAHPDRPPTAFSPFVFQSWLSTALRAQSNIDELTPVVESVIKDQPASAATIVWTFVQELESEERVDVADNVVDIWLKLTDSSKWDTTGARIAIWRILRAAQRNEPDLAIDISRRVDQAGHLGNFVAPGSASTTLIEFLYSQVAQAFYAEKHRDSYEYILQKVLQTDPDHAGANNDLGYALVDRGENLKLAEKLILTAFRQDPERPAYMDSIGWLRYKQGRFGDLGDEPEQLGAVSLLKQAVTHRDGRDDPVILDHYGDALWRSGATTDAVDAWKSAVDAYKKQRENMQSLGEDAVDAITSAYGDVVNHAEEKIQSAENGKTPDVAQIVKE